MLEATDDTKRASDEGSGFSTMLLLIRTKRCAFLTASSGIGIIGLVCFFWMMRLFIVRQIVLLVLAPATLV